MVSDTKRVIVDLDVGSDDAYALLLLIYAEKLAKVKIEAIVCTKGNTTLENVSRNVVRLLQILKRTDIPVYKGSAEEIITPEQPLQQFHGVDGFGDLKLTDEPDLSMIRKEPAAVAMREIVVNNPGQISLVCIGPLTNAALTMKLFDDFAPNIKDIFILGGNYAATGNITETAEFNFYADPEGAYIVLNNAQCPVTIVTWETCLETNINFDWRYNVLGSIQNPFMELLNKVERSIYADCPLDSTWYPCDSLIIIAMVFPDESIIRQSKHNATVELHGWKTRGQIVLDHLKQKVPNVTVVEKMNCEFIKQILLKAASL